jgi:DNA polymerase-1
MHKKKLVLVDGSYYMFRAYFATQRQGLKNAQGEPTGAIFGVVNMLRKLIAEYQPDYFAVVFDAKGKSFRSDIYPQYKAHRPPMPEDLVYQIQPIHDIVRAQGFPLLVIDSVEADDVIATLALQGETQGLATTISTGDKDLAQIVNENITLINTMSDLTLDPDGVVEKYGVRPDQIIDYLTLVGDSADNVPGVSKVGPKTACKWLSEYDNLETIIQHADDIKGKVGENLRASLDSIPLSKELVTLKTDVDLDLKPEDLRIEDMDKDALIEQYGRWEFRHLLSTVSADNSGETEIVADEEAPAPEYTTIFKLNELEKWLKLIKQSDVFAFDTETTSLNFMQARIVGVSFCVQENNAAYVPVDHDYPGAPEQLSWDSVAKLLKPVLEAENIKKVGQNLKYDQHVLANHGISLKGIAHDTMLESYVFDSTATRHDMDSLALKYLETETIHYEDIAGKGAKQITFNQVAIEEAGPYAAEDADITLKLHNHLWS